MVRTANSAEEAGMDLLRGSVVRCHVPWLPARERRVDRTTSILPTMAGADAAIGFAEESPDRA